MKILNRILLIMAVGYAVFTAIIFYRIIFGSLPFYGGRWKLVWSDEFNTPALDLSKWSAVNLGSSPNGETQAFIDENIGVQDGFLVITSKKETWTGPDNLRPGEAVTRGYTSGQVVTREKVDWTFGRFEIRAKLPQNQRLAPQFGLLSTNGGNPQEVGVRGTWDDSGQGIFMINRWKRDGLVQEDNSTFIFMPETSADFHIFTFQWEPGNLRWYVDGVQRFQVKRNIPDQPLCLSLKTAMGGLYSDNPSVMPAGGDNIDRPEVFLVDWVRVYQRR